MKIFTFTISTYIKFYRNIENNITFLSAFCTSIHHNNNNFGLKIKESSNNLENKSICIVCSEKLCWHVDILAHFNTSSKRLPLYIDCERNWINIQAFDIMIHPQDKVHSRIIQLWTVAATTILNVHVNTCIPFETYCI